MKKNWKRIAIAVVLIAGLLAFVGYRYEDLSIGNLYTNTITSNSGNNLVINAPLLRDTETVTAANVLTYLECGTTYFLNAQAGFQTTLPAISTVSTGCDFKFIVKAAPSDGSYTIITGNSLENVIAGGINELEVDTSDDGPYIAAGDTITIVATVAVAGDYVDFVSDGAKYYMRGQTNADGGATAAQAD